MPHLRKASREELYSHLSSLVEWDILWKEDGATLGDEVVDDVIRALRRILPGQSTQQLELLMADVRRDIVHKLSKFADGLIDYDYAIREIVQDGGIFLAIDDEAEA
jgi:hypothetical protein